jgi:hypothetical protein
MPMPKILMSGPLVRGLQHNQLFPVFPVAGSPLRFGESYSEWTVYQGRQGMKRIYMLISAIALILLVGPCKSRAEVMYKWLDDNGQVHFSDRAPQDRKTEKTDIRSSSGKENPGITTGLRDSERRLLGLSRERKNKILQARRRSVSKHAAGESRCTTARNRYDQAKRKPGAAKSPLVRRYYEEMKELCR